MKREGNRETSQDGFGRKGPVVFFSVLMIASTWPIVVTSAAFSLLSSVQLSLLAGAVVGGLGICVYSLCGKGAKGASEEETVADNNDVSLVARGSYSRINHDIPLAASKLDDTVGVKKEGVVREAPQPCSLEDATVHNVLNPALMRAVM